MKKQGVSLAFFLILFLGYEERLLRRKVYFCEKTARNTERREGEKVI